MDKGVNQDLITLDRPSLSLIHTFRVSHLISERPSESLFIPTGKLAKEYEYRTMELNTK